jgi:hypothetical protein
MRDVIHQLLSGARKIPESMSSYHRERQTELAASLAHLKPIYLDTRFWVELRRAQEKGQESPAFGLLETLRKAVGSGVAFCPISASSFMELLQHGDSAVRTRTAKLVDELSLGVSIIALDELFASELEWLVTKAKDVPLDPLAVPLWTKLSYALGSLSISFPPLPATQQLAFQVAAFDMLWDMPFAECADTLQRARPDLSREAAKISEDSQVHGEEILDFTSAYRAEAWGVAQASVRICRDFLRSLGATSPIMSDEGEFGPWAKLIAGGLIQGKARQALRSMHVRACWHAMFRLNRQRRFKQNDFTDIEHAAAGVSYCRAFFSERSLVTVLTQPPVCLDQLYRCVITSDLGTAEQFVSQLIT